MKEKIYYLENSLLLSRSLTDFYTSWKWTVFRNEESLLKALFKEPPSLMIIGDTGTDDIWELLFFIKSIKGYRKIPILFYGESELASILPIEGILSREAENEKEREKIIKRNLETTFLSSNERSLLTPLDPLPDKKIRREFFSRILKGKIFQKQIQNGLSVMDITNLSFEGVMEKLIMTLNQLLSCHFIFLAYPFEGEFYYQISSDKDEEEEKTLLNTLKNNFAAREKMEIGGKSFPLRGDGEKEGIIILGGLEEIPRILPERLLVQLAAIADNILLRAAGLYGSLNETQIIYRAFSQFLPSAIIDDLLLKESEKALMTGEKRRVTALFSHIRDFDYIIENNEPQRIVEFLNSHFTNMVAIIQWNGGIIDKFIGDAVFAIFGAPISYTDNTPRAARAAMEMIENYHDINLEALNLPPGGFSIGVGLNEGEAIIGNIGCSDKFDYTAIGDTVNLAARLESLTKHYHEDILVSRSVYNSIHEEMYCRLIDRAKVKGKNESTEIYSLVTDPETYTREWKETYGKGLKMYSLGNWYTAEEYFTRVLTLRPHDRVCEILLERCRDFLENTPTDWDGAVTLNFK
jgi:class 3 adenylate cyclase